MVAPLIKKPLGYLVQLLEIFRMSPHVRLSVGPLVPLPMLLSEHLSKSFGIFLENMKKGVGNSLGTNPVEVGCH